MTLRDYFAAAAITGLFGCGPFQADIPSYVCDDAAKSAYIIADAMLKAREQ